MATFQSQINILTSALTTLYDTTHAFSSSIATNTESVKILEGKKHFDDDVNMQPYSILTDEAQALLDVSKDSVKIDTYSNFLLQAIQNSNYGYYESQVNSNKIQALSERVDFLENNTSSSSSVNYIGNINIKSDGSSFSITNHYPYPEETKTKTFTTLNEALEILLPLIEQITDYIDNLYQSIDSIEHVINDLKQ